MASTRSLTMQETLRTTLPNFMGIRKFIPYELSGTKYEVPSHRRTKPPLGTNVYEKHVGRTHEKNNNTVP